MHNLPHGQWQQRARALCAQRTSRSAASASHTRSHPPQAHLLLVFGLRDAVLRCGARMDHPGIYPAYRCLDASRVRAIRMAVRAGTPQMLIHVRRRWCGSSARREPSRFEELSSRTAFKPRKIAVHSKIEESTQVILFIRGHSARIETTYQRPSRKQMTVRRRGSNDVSRRPL